MRQILILLLVLSLALSGYLYYEQNRLKQAEQLVVYFIRATPTNFLLVPAVRTVSEPVTPQKAVELLLAGPDETEEFLHPAVPVETKLLGLTIENRTAVANFSEELRTKFVGGSQLESHLVNAIVSTLIQFPEIDQVRILIEGKPVESIAGHIYIDYNLP
ncbi:MAG: GerMN domain-containing protein [Firmicutes bacterium]|jgi:spore germination protein GerM|nr:GerMN domain-containing protein [Bacillota bacterium]